MAGENRLDFVAQVALVSKMYGCFPCKTEDKAPDYSICNYHNDFRTGRKATDEELERWFNGAPERLVGVWVGQNDTQVIDIDDGALWDYWEAAVDDNGLTSVLDKCAIVETRNGYHVWAKVPGCVDGNQKLAKFDRKRYSLDRDKQVDTRIETRGVGGYAIIPPSPGYRYIRGHINELEPITLEEWNGLCLISRLFDQRPQEAVVDQPKSAPKGRGISPGDDFNARGPSCLEMLERHGWVARRKTGQRIGVVRPGKNPRDGISGTVTEDGSVFCCFSSNAHPFEEFDESSRRGCYSRFAVYALLEHRGDFKAAAKALVADGYGEQSTAPVVEWNVEDSGLPVIETNGVPLRDLTAAALEAITKANEPPTTFVRTGSLVKVTWDEHRRPRIQPMDGPVLRGHLDRVAEWVSTSSKRGSVSVMPPPAVVDDIPNLSPFPTLPVLVGIGSAPAVAPNGNLRLEPGYCRDSKMFLASSESWEIAGVSAEEAAKWIFDEVLVDFPFQSEADKANALGLMLLPFVRPCIDGPTPLHDIDAPSMGTGKSLLGKVCLFPYTGCEIPAMTAPDAEEEWRKKLTSALIAGDQAIMIDNISKKVDSDALAAILTATEWRDRALGSSTIITLPVRCAWVATSNNAQLSVDIARRSVGIRLDAQSEKPWQREGFKHPKILPWMAKNRRQIVAHLLAMVDAWVKAGMPKWNGRPLGSFEAYSEVLGGILDVAKVEGFLTNWEVMFESTNAEELSWKGFYDRWYENFGSDPVKVSDLFDKFIEDDALVSLLNSSTEQGQKVKLGTLLRKRAGRVIGDMRIEKTHKHQGALRFKILKGLGVYESRESFIYNAGEYPEDLDSKKDTLLKEAGNTHETLRLTESQNDTFVTDSDEGVEEWEV